MSKKTKTIPVAGDDQQAPPINLQAMADAFTKAVVEGAIEIDIPDAAVNASIMAKVRALEARLNHLTDELLLLKQDTTGQPVKGRRIDVLEEAQ